MNEIKIMVLSLSMMGFSCMNFTVEGANSLCIWHDVGMKNTCEVFVEWPNGDKINIVYTDERCGIGNCGELVNVSGGIAVSGTGVDGYAHSCYPVDYAENQKPELEIFADNASVLKVTGLGKTKTGRLCQDPALLKAKEVKIIFRGRLKGVDMDIVVEQVVRADVPRMLFSHIMARYTKRIMVNRLYHQMVQANPSFSNGDISLMVFDDKPKIISGLNVPEHEYNNFNNGIFYIRDKEQYVGFLSGRNDCLRFHAWRNGTYIAAYKILVEKQNMDIGEVTESRGISCWGTSADEAMRLLDMTENVKKMQAVLPEAKAISNFIGMTLTH